MQGEDERDSASVQRPILRRIALGLAVLELVLGGGFAIVLLGDAGDPLAISISRGVAMLIGVALAVTSLPALLLAWHGQWPIAALLLALAAPLALVFLMEHG